MGRNKGSKNIPLRIENIEIYNYYRTRLLSAALSQFDWYNLPETCDPLYFERELVFKGMASIYNLPESPETWLSTGFVFNSGFNVYGYPAQIQGVGYNMANIPVDKFVVCYDNVNKENLMPYINYCAKQLYEVHNTFRSNLRQQNTPYLVKTDRNTLLTIRNFFNNLFGYDPVIEVRPSFDSNSIEALDLRVDFKGRDMLECLEIVWKQALSFLGITQSSSKKERMIEDEVALDRMADGIALESRFKPRQDFCKRFNRLGFNISVDLAVPDIIFEPYKEDEENADTSTDDTSTDDTGSDNTAD